MNDHKRCTGCGETKALSEFYRNGSGYRSECKSCISIKRRAWYVKDAEDLRDRKRLSRHGIDRAQYDVILAERGGGCGICGSDNDGKTFHVDHDHRCCPGRHSCGACIRGVLCRRCSVGIGSLGDQYETVLHALAYLARWDRQRERAS